MVVVNLWLKKNEFDNFDNKFNKTDTKSIIKFKNNLFKNTDKDNI